MPALRVAPEDLQAALQGLAIPYDLTEIRSMLYTRAEHWKDDWKREGIQEGLQEGLRKGRQEGQASTLLRLLQGRFGELPAWASDRVVTADSTTLDHWTLSLLDAAKLEDIVGRNRSKNRAGTIAYRHHNQKARIDVPRHQGATAGCIALERLIVYRRAIGPLRQSGISH